LFRGAGERHGQAEALNNLGELLTRTSATRHLGTPDEKRIQHTLREHGI
jgi:hypothetical protein